MVTVPKILTIIGIDNEYKQVVRDIRIKRVTHFKIMRRELRELLLDTGVSPTDAKEVEIFQNWYIDVYLPCLLYTSPSPRDLSTSRMPSSA